MRNKEIIAKVTGITGFLLHWMVMVGVIKIVLVIPYFSFWKDYQILRLFYVGFLILLGVFLVFISLRLITDGLLGEPSEVEGTILAAVTGYLIYFYLSEWEELTTFRKLVASVLIGGFLFLGGGIMNSFFIRSKLEGGFPRHRISKYCKKNTAKIEICTEEFAKAFANCADHFSFYDEKRKSCLEKGGFSEETIKRTMEEVFFSVKEECEHKEVECEEKIIEELPKSIEEILKEKGLFFGVVKGGEDKSRVPYVDVKGFFLSFDFKTPPSLGKIVEGIMNQ